MEGGRRKNPILGENTRQQIWKGKRTTWRTWKEQIEDKEREEKIKEEEKLGILSKDQRILKHNHQVYYETMDRLGKKENCEVKYTRR